MDEDVSSASQSDEPIVISHNAILQRFEHLAVSTADVFAREFAENVRHPLELLQSDGSQIRQQMMSLPRWLPRLTPEPNASPLGDRRKRCGNGKPGTPSIIRFLVRGCLRRREPMEDATREFNRNI
ncbi:unnamed protein product [Cyprideis torosa]|uniref:Uncharacterized protein n=1 Tax=Cyprideis torosa TaxID=163714 RepID=A0A7R8W650_9CRUS|nr:unnamed protein product [Cyprideis torosa]CAG0880953.1 unnamed protein product [Cyprideis torosa]